MKTIVPIELQGSGVVQSVHAHEPLLINGKIGDKGNIEPFPTPLSMGQLLDDAQTTTLEPEICAIIPLEDFDIPTGYGVNKLTRLLIINTLAIDSTASQYYTLSIFAFNRENLQIFGWEKKWQQASNNGNIETMPYFNPNVLNRAKITAFIVPFAIPLGKQIGSLYNRTLIVIDEPRFQGDTSAGAAIRASYIWYAQINDIFNSAVSCTSLSKASWLNTSAILQTTNAKTASKVIKTEIKPGLITDVTAAIEQTSGNGGIAYQNFLPTRPELRGVDSISLAVQHEKYIFFYNKTQNVIFCSQQSDPLSILWLPDKFPVYTQIQGDAVISPPASTALGEPWTFSPSERLIDMVSYGDGILFVTSTGFTKYTFTEVDYPVSVPLAVGALDIVLKMPSLTESPELRVIAPIAGPGSVAVIKNVLYYITQDAKLYRYARAQKDGKEFLELTDGNLPGMPALDFNAPQGQPKFEPTRNLLPLSVSGSQCLVSNYIMANLHTLAKDGTASFSHLLPTLQFDSNVLTTGGSIPKRITATAEAPNGGFFALRNELFYMPKFYDINIMNAMSLVRYSDPFGALTYGFPIPEFDTSGGGKGQLIRLRVDFSDTMESLATNTPPNDAKRMNVSFACSFEGSGDASDIIRYFTYDYYWLNNDIYVNGLLLKRAQTDVSNESFTLECDIFKYCRTAFIYMQSHASASFPANGLAPPFTQYMQKYQIKSIKAEVVQAVSSEAQQLNFDAAGDKGAQ